MATFIPTLNSCLTRMTSGEKRLGRILDSHLDDDYIVWYNPLVGECQWEPDFVILHPQRGLLVLEVKDWNIDSIGSDSDRQKIVLKTPDGKKKVDHPLEQVKKYAYAIERLLSRDQDLIQTHGQYQGKLLFPYAYGAVFSNISRAVSAEFLEDIINPDLIICRDEMTEKTDAEGFQAQLSQMFKHRFDCDLGPEQIDRIRFHLFPQLRHQTARLLAFQQEHPSAFAPISQALLSNGLLIDFDCSDSLPPVQPIEIPVDLIEIMDFDQEKIARGLGDGHRIIHGVAGSGKTMILLYRCEYLASLKPDKPILVLCFNVTLSARLREIITSKGISNKLVEVIHFHEWMKSQMKKHRQSVPFMPSKKEYAEELERRMIQAVETGVIPGQQYSAVLIDEGHDLQADWLKMLVKMPENESFLLLYDDAQNIYGNKQKQKFSFKSVGIKAQGRSSILKINYRNTVEVLNLAYKFASEVLPATVDNDEDTPVLIAPQSANRHGSVPQLISQPNLSAEIQYLIQMTKRYQEQGIPLKEMAIIYRDKITSKAQQIYDDFKRADIPIDWLNENDLSRNYDPQSDKIKLVTMHSSKGLEFAVVMIPGVGAMPSSESSAAEEARLLYVAMTRSIDKLLLTYSRDSLFVNKLKTTLAAANEISN
jgi:UvrD-like helicase C-terminal domain/Nuclease-related domain/AAA domain